MKVKGYYKTIGSSTWILRASTNECVNTLRCPYSGYTQTDTFNVDGCKDYKAIVWIDVMYRGNPVWYYKVSKDESNWARYCG